MAKFRRWAWRLAPAVAVALAGCGGGGTMPGASPVPPSCRVAGAGTTWCGASGESCCVSPSLPAGTYDRTYDNDGTAVTGRADPAQISAFRLDRYLVTVGRFRQFVAARTAGWNPPAGSGKHAHLNGGRGLVDSDGSGYEAGWGPVDDSFLPALADWTMLLDCEAHFQTWTDAPGPNEALPMSCISWYDAYAFCIWDGGFLPSEAEWEYAAAGGDEQRAYPWGSTDPIAGGPEYAIAGCDYPAGSTTCTGVVNVAPVGTAVRGAGRWGQLDLAGSLSEWTLDWLAPYKPCTDCVFLTDYSYRVVRGGSFGTDTLNLLANARVGDTPQSRPAFYGARCARSP